MPTVSGNRWARWLLLLALTACAGQIFAAAKCDQPQVSFQAGQLTVSSSGCSLRQVLTAVGRQTGVETELPASTAVLPVFVSLGPGDPRRVVSALLDGIAFNWRLSLDKSGSGKLLAIVLSERILPLEPAQPSTLADARAEAHAKGSIPADTESNQARRRVELDEATMSKLPQLPPGIPSGIWGLYPSLVANGGVAPSGPPLLANGQPVPQPSVAPSSLSSLYNLNFDPSAGPKGCANCPVPPGVPPGIVNVYPANLMQLLQMPIMYPNVPTPPLMTNFLPVKH